MNGVNKFIIRLIAMGVLVSLFISLFVITKADGNLDPYYNRFKSAPAGSLILGTSRAAQGIVPTTIEEGLEDTSMSKPILNFAFTLIHSSYGETYLNAIKNKLDPNTKNGLFILAVDPWSISTTSTTDDPSEFLETETFMEELSDMSSNPNLEYLLHHYDGPFYKAFKKRASFLHNDGWLEVSVPMDSINVAKRTKQKVIDYTANAKSYRFSKHRFDALKSTIQFLQEHGKVVLVRLPVSTEIQRIEKYFINDFDAKIDVLNNELNTPYLNLINRSGDFQTTDGNHLYKKSAVEVSEIITKFINQ